MLLVEAANFSAFSVCDIKSINDAAASGCCVDLNATIPDPPGIAPHPPGPQGIGTTFHSKSVMLVS